jgi:hypothetical protein
VKLAAGCHTGGKRKVIRRVSIPLPESKDQNLLPFKALLHTLHAVR